jgi:S-layer homology domain
MNTRVIAALCAATILALTMSSTTVALAAPDTAAAAAPNAVPFPDVPENDFAFDAIRRLAADGYLTGYPDGSFKGNRPMTRYEASFLVSKIVNAMKDQIAKGQSPPSDDIALINQLAERVSGDLKDITTRVAALQTSQDAVKKEADASRDNLRGMQILLNVFQRP